MVWIISAILAVVFAFSIVVFFGAPYLPTLKPQINTAFELLHLEAGQTLLELGCGDGRVLIAAAERGLKVVGYELNPFLALLAWIRTRRYGNLVTVKCANFWLQKWPEADGIFVFLHTRFMVKLDKKIKSESRRSVKLVSFAFPIPGRKMIDEKNGLFLYEY